MSNVMSPQASPAGPRKSGVRRVNNMPMYLIGGVVLAFIIIMILVAADRAAKQNRVGEGVAVEAGSSARFAEALIGDRDNGLITPDAPPALVEPPVETTLQPPAVDLLSAAPARPLEPYPLILPNDALLPPPAPPSVEEEAAQRIRAMKLQMLEAAARARTGVETGAALTQRRAFSPSLLGDASQSRDDMSAQIAAVRQQIDAALQEDPSAAFQARLEQVRGLDSGGAATAAPVIAPAPAAPTSPPGGNSIAEFAGGGGDRWRLDASLRPPRSAYELRAGYVAPAVLVSGINSALPGQIVAQVSRDVYDTATGRHVLIPQGSRLVGTYSSEVDYGQSRVLIAWQRIVFPDARAIDIGAMPGADSAGFAGFADQVDNHYFRLFGSAFLMSAITAGISMSQDNAAGRAGGNRQRASDAMSEALGQQLGQVTAQMIERNLNIAPTIEIRPGYRFNVIVTKDLTFARPYRAFDYN